MQIPPIIPESIGSAAPAQRKESAAINGLIQLIAGASILPRADPRLATIVVPPTVQLGEAAVTAERDRKLLVDSKTSGQQLQVDRGQSSYGRIGTQSSDGGIALDLGVWLKQLSRQSGGPIRWPGNEAGAAAMRRPFFGSSQLSSLVNSARVKSEATHLPIAKFIVSASPREFSRSPTLPGPVTHVNPAANASLPSELPATTSPRVDPMVGMAKTSAKTAAARFSAAAVLTDSSAPVAVSEAFGVAPKSDGTTKVVAQRSSTAIAALDVSTEVTASTTSTVDRPFTNAESQPRGNEVRLLMNALVKGLALSNLFAARNLASWVSGERLRNSVDESASRLVERSAIAVSEMPIDESDLVSGVPRKLVEQWMQGIESDSSDALEAAQLLLNGKLIWQGQLSDGTPMLMQRYDVWRETKKQREPVERGVGISIETDLKNRGPVKIEGWQWRDALEIIVTGNDPISPPNSWDGWHDLVERLRDRAGASVISRVTDAPDPVADVR